MVEVSPGFCLIGAALVLLVPLPWVAAALLAGAFHECCHLAVIRLLGGRVTGMQLRAGGAEISVSGLSDWQELLAAGAGPAGSLALLLLRRQFPELAFCGLIQGLHNLLPVYPMDGGRILLCGLSMALGPERGRRVAGWVGTVTGAAALVLGIFLTLSGGFSLFLPVLIAEIGWKAKKFLQTGASGITIG